MLHEAGGAMLRCPSCGHACKDLNKHYGLKPACFKIESEKPPAPRARASTAGDEAESHFKLKFARRINIDYVSTTPISGTRDSWTRRAAMLF